MSNFRRCAARSKWPLLHDLPSDDETIIILNVLGGVNLLHSGRSRTSLRLRPFQSPAVGDPSPQPRVAQPPFDALARSHARYSSARSASRKRRRSSSTSRSASPRRSRICWGGGSMSIRGRSIVTITAAFSGVHYNPAPLYLLACY